MHQKLNGVVNSLWSQSGSGSSFLPQCGFGSGSKIQREKPMRIRISMLTPIQIRIRIGIKTMPILVRITRSFTHVKNQNFFIKSHIRIGLEYFIFLIIVIYAMIFSIFDRI
jgi:hypothetical protein